jgi:hypothetical protein
VFGLDLECLELCRVNKEYDTSTFIWLLLFVQLVFSDTNHWYFFFDELSSHTRSLFVYWHPDFTVCLGQGVFWKVLHEGDVQSRGLSRDPNAFLFLQGVLPTGQCSLPSFLPQENFICFKESVPLLGFGCSCFSHPEAEGARVIEFEGF